MGRLFLNWCILFLTFACNLELNSGMELKLWVFPYKCKFLNKQTERMKREKLLISSFTVKSIKCRGHLGERNGVNPWDWTLLVGKVWWGHRQYNERREDLTNEKSERFQNGVQAPGGGGAPQWREPTCPWKKGTGYFFFPFKKPKGSLSPFLFTFCLTNRYTLWNTS